MQWNDINVELWEITNHCMRIHIVYNCSYVKKKKLFIINLVRKGRKYPVLSERDSVGKVDLNYL